MKRAAPENGPDSPWRVKTVEALAEYRLLVRFLDGIEGFVDMRGFVHSSRAGVFSPLSDPIRFNEVIVHQGVVTWPGEIDLAPDAMYDAIKASGEWVLT